MEKTDDINIFIKSLSNGEKKGLSQFLKNISQDSKSDYFQLYSVYQDHKTYDPKRIKKEYKGKNLYQTKAYLLSLIEEYLIKIKSQSAQQFVMQKLLNEYWINMERSNFKRAEKKIIKAIEYGEKHELYNQLQSAFGNYLNFLFSFIPRSKEEVKKQMDELSIKSKNNMIRLEIHQYFRRFNTHFLESKINLLAPQKLRDLIQEIDTKIDVKIDLGCWLEIYATRAKLELNNMLSDHLGCCSNANRAVEIFENHPYILTNNMGAYISSLLGQINALIQVKDEIKLEISISKLINIYSSLENNSGMVNNYYTYACNNVITSLSKSNIILRITPKLLNLSNTLNNGECALYNSHFLLEKAIKKLHEKECQISIELINEFLSNEEFKTYNIEQSIANLILIIAHLEKGNLKYLNAIAKKSIKIIKDHCLKGDIIDVFLIELDTFSYHKDDIDDLFNKVLEKSKKKEFINEWKSFFNLKRWIENRNA